jgi:hypothetical protein
LSTIGVPAGVDQKVTRSDHEWYATYNLTELQRYYIIDSLIKSKEGSTSVSTTASRFAATYIHQKIPGYYWSVVVAKTRESVSGYYVPYQTDYVFAFFRLDGDVYSAYAFK